MGGTKSEKMQFFESFFSFPYEIGKKEQIQNSYWLINNSEPGEPLAAAPGVVGGRAKKQAFLKQIEWAFSKC